MKTHSVIGMLAWMVFAAQLYADVLIQIDAGGHDRKNCPVTFRVPDEMNDVDRFVLTRQSDGKQIDVQSFGPQATPRITWMIHDRLPSGETRTYNLSAAADDTPKPKSSVNCQDDGKRLTVSVDGTEAIVFNHATIEAPEGIDAIYRRSGYFHPIKTPQGNTVTGDFEPDHPHQHGLFNAWVNTTFRGESVDFWNQAKGKGDVECTKLQRRQISGSVFAQFRTTLTHVAIKDGKRVPAVEESMTVRVYNAKPFLIDIVSRQTTATEDAVQVNENNYGGFALRGPSEWLVAADPNPNNSENSDPPAVADFLTSSGRTRTDGNHTRARWVKMHGPIGSRHAGIIAMAAESNFRAPQTVRLHPTRPYFCFAPMVLGSFSLEPDDEYSSRFRYVVYDGEPDAKFAERMWQDYAHPPEVKILQ